MIKTDQRLKWVPNCISLMRGCIIAPIVLWCSLQLSWKTTFMLFIMGALTDGLDGWLAGKLNARTRIGRYVIDPFADAALTGAAIIGLIVASKLPWWFLALAATVSLVFYLAIMFTKGRASRFIEGLFPFWGISCGLFVAAVLAFAAFQQHIIYLLPPALIGGLIALKKFFI